LSHGSIVSPLYRRLEREGRLLTRDWSLYDGQHVVFTPAQMSVDELRDGHERAWRHAYRLPAILKRVGAATYRLLAILAANVGYRFYSSRLRDFAPRTAVEDAASVPHAPAGGGAMFPGPTGVGNPAR
jgi:hypothetical protein